MAKLTAQFETSAFALDRCPRWNRVEVAIAGRSNVGKSSLLNALTGVKRLARTSGTPGRTQSLNFFVAGAGLALVDLPGYGYARVPEKIAREIAAMMTDYLSARENLAALVLLVDSRRGPEAEEARLAATARARGVEVIFAATKCDKLKRSERAAALARFGALEAAPLLCSATSGEGIDDLRRRILRIAHDSHRPSPGFAEYRTPSR
ncbi:MAG TPA: ribosome biogenesis GTP-binding protein YihA/YsxC [Candidatus Binataceae bacterium]|nr:ribosome biogenesis GTP-binding protein YihA/YsxC [Candidatus Binataceae bacterium]